MVYAVRMATEAMGPVALKECGGLPQEAEDDPPRSAVQRRLSANQQHVGGLRTRSSRRGGLAGMGGVYVEHALPPQPAQHRHLARRDKSDVRRDLCQLQGPALDEGSHGKSR